MSHPIPTPRTPLSVSGATSPPSVSSTTLDIRPSTSQPAWSNRRASSIPILAHSRAAMTCSRRLPCFSPPNNGELGSRTLLIAAPINVGASLLLLTPHQVLAAPYHRNTEGLRDIMQVFYRDEATARTAITRRHVDLLLLYPDESIASHERREDSTLFYDELLQGETPEWLESVPLDGSTRLFRVAGPASGTAIEP